MAEAEKGSAGAVVLRELARERKAKDEWRTRAIEAEGERGSLRQALEQARINADALTRRAERAEEALVAEKGYIVVSRSRISATDALDAERKILRRMRGPGTHEVVRVTCVSAHPSEGQPEEPDDDE